MPRQQGHPSPPPCAFLAESIHPSSSTSSLQVPNVANKNSSSLSKFPIPSSLYCSDSRSSLNPFSSSSLYQSVFFALWVSMLRGLCSVRHIFFYFRFCLGSVTPEKASHRFRLCLVSIRTSFVFLDLVIKPVLSRTILASNPAPSLSPSSRRLSVSCRYPHPRFPISSIHSSNSFLRSSSRSASSFFQRLFFAVANVPSYSVPRFN